MPAPLPVPDDRDPQAVQAWLRTGAYLEWELGSPSSATDVGMAMSGGSRVYLSPELAASLRAGASTHPLGAAAVRELLDPDSGEHGGWAFSHKLELELDEGETGQEWFFYEVFSTEADAEALVSERGASGCVGCHADGIDHVMSEAL